MCSLGPAPHLTAPGEHGAVRAGAGVVRTVRPRVSCSINVAQAMPCPTSPFIGNRVLR